MTIHHLIRKGILLLAASSIGFAGSATAKTLRVTAGQSIQAAIDRAAPGDEIRIDPGVYYEQVVIEKDGLTLSGAGASEGGTILQPPASRRETDCSEGTTFQDGVCVLGNPTVDGVTIEGLLIRGFPDGGVTAISTSDLTVKDVRSEGNFFGIFSQFGHNGRFQHNVVSHNIDLGLFIADSPNATAVVEENEAFGNRVGIITEDSSHGRVVNNYSHDNAGGIGISNAGHGASDWTVSDNRVEHNNLAKAAGDPFPGAPAISGSGISIQGSTNTTVKNNKVNDNQPAFANKFAGGIELHSTAYAGGSDPLTDVVKDNKLERNLPTDLRWDDSGSPTFQNNHCESSSPVALCSSH